MAAAKPRAPVVVTGFRPFPGVAANPSQIVVEALQASPGTLPDGAECRLLEVAYAAVPPALDEILVRPPAALVLTGYSALAQGLELERRASSIRSPRFPDARGFCPASRPGAPVDIQENRACDVPALEAALRTRGIACQLSDDCGHYVCNSAYHTALARIAARTLPTRAIFVHLPAVAGTPLAETSASAMELTEMAAGVATIARLLAGEPTFPPAIR